ncbi:MAG TPA: SGNH/GDSL hydrolase family protein, partial [Verrucomicrobiae bacterium]
MQRFFALLSLGLLLLLPHFAAGQNTNSFELLDGDRVALIGDTFIEREQSYGYLEYLMTIRYPGRDIKFRNLGWSADTPVGVSRAGFDTPDKGFDRVKEQITAFKPTVVFIGYGMASSFDGIAGLDRFKSEMEKLMDSIQDICGKDKVRFVLLSPIRHEKLFAPLPDPAEHNQVLEQYVKAIESLAQKRDAWYISFFTKLDNRTLGGNYYPLTDNGIHLTDYGYRRAAETLGYAFK